MLGICCAWTEPGAISKARTAAARKTFMGCSLHFLAQQRITAAMATPSTCGALQMIRFAGFRQPIVPDRAAFGTTVQQKAQGDYAENQCQSPEHRPPLLLARLYFPKSGIFKPSLVFKPSLSRRGF